jgi:hypothetical protein
VSRVCCTAFSPRLEELFREAGKGEPVHLERTTAKHFRKALSLAGSKGNPNDLNLEDVPALWVAAAELRVNTVWLHYETMTALRGARDGGALFEKWLEASRDVPFSGVGRSLRDCCLDFLGVAPYRASLLPRLRTDEVSLLLGKRAFSAEREVEVFDLLVAWVAAGGSERLQDEAAIDTLISLVRFEEFTQVELDAVERSDDPTVQSMLHFKSETLLSLLRNAGGEACI